MSRIIDLKNKGPEKPKQDNSHEFMAENRPRTNPPPNPLVRPEIKTAQPLGQNSEETAVKKPEAPQSKIISWSAELYRQSDFKTVVVISLVLFLIAVLVQIFQGNIITTVFFALLGMVLLLNTKKKSETGSFEVGSLGIKVERKLYGFREIKSFWIEYEPTLGIKELSLQLKKWYMPYIKIPIGDQNPVQIRSALLEFLPEVEHQDTFVEILSRKLGI